MMSMKKMLLLVLFSTFFIACKKDQIGPDEEIVYVQRVPESAVPPTIFGGWSVKFKANQKAEIVPAGDIVYGGTYKASGPLKTKGTRIEINAEGKKYQFIVVSSTEIRNEFLSLYERSALKP
jgi:hypothetical protein